MSQSLRIAWMVPGGVDRSGRERVIPHFLWLMEELSRDHEVHVISLHQDPEPCSYPLRGATVHGLGNIREDRPLDHEPCLALEATMDKAREILTARGPWDILHGFWAFHAGWLAATLGRELHIPSVVSLLGAEFVSLPEISYGGQTHERPRRMVAQTTERANALTVASRFMGDLTRAQGLHPEYIPFGVPDPCFLEGLAADHPPWRLLHVGSINRVKNQSLLLAAMQRVVAVNPDVSLDILGMDTLQGELHSLVDCYSLTRNVSLHGYIPNDVARSFFQQAHVYLVSSLHETGPIAMLEAAACGVPTVGTPVGYVADWAGERAIAVPHNDSDAMAATILELLVDTPRRRALGDAARDWVRRHDSRWTAENFLRLYRSLL